MNLTYKLEIKLLEKPQYVICNAKNVISYVRKIYYLV